MKVTATFNLIYGERYELHYQVGDDPERYIEFNAANWHAAVVKVWGHLTNTECFDHHDCEVIDGDTGEVISSQQYVASMAGKYEGDL